MLPKATLANDPFRHRRSCVIGTAGAAVASTHIGMLPMAQLPQSLHGTTCLNLSRLFAPCLSDQTVSQQPCKSVQAAHVTPKDRKQKNSPTSP